MGFWGSFPYVEIRASGILPLDFLGADWGIYKELDREKYLAQCLNLRPL